MKPKDIYVKQILNLPNKLIDQSQSLKTSARGKQEFY